MAQNRHLKAGVNPVAERPAGGPPVVRGQTAFRSSRSSICDDIDESAELFAKWFIVPIN
jgi:hypothetical protein